MSFSHLAELVERLQNFLLNRHLKVGQKAGQHLLHETAHLQNSPGIKTGSKAEGQRAVKVEAVFIFIIIIYPDNLPRCCLKLNLFQPKPINKEKTPSWILLLLNPGVYHLIEDCASKSFRLSAMLMDSSISGSFFCRDRSTRVCYRKP